MEVSISRDVAANSGNACYKHVANTPTTVEGSKNSDPSPVKVEMLAFEPATHTPKTAGTPLRGTPATAGTEAAVGRQRTSSAAWFTNQSREASKMDKI
jgi:hypothetical protein